MDEIATIDQLKRKVQRFREERDWVSLDTPRSLAISIVLEAAELLENFQWDNQDFDLEKVADEFADVLIYSLGFSLTLKIDIADAVARKLRKNEIKYPLPAEELISRKMP